METKLNRIEEFRRLHEAGRPVPLLLPAAWDGPSARMHQAGGAAAIALTSAGLAWSQGNRNGRPPAPATLGAAVAEIVRDLAVPLTVDIDSAVPADSTWIDEVVAAMIDAGAVGIDLADGAASPDVLCARIASAKAAAVRAGVDLFVNARTDVYLRGLMPIERSIPETIDRARSYIGAGSDSVFVPGVADSHHIRSIASALQMPLNVLAHPLLPALDVLSALGVRRVSMATSAIRADNAAPRHAVPRVHGARFAAMFAAMRSAAA